VVVTLPNNAKAGTTADANGNWTMVLPGASSAKAITIFIYDKAGIQVGQPITTEAVVKAAVLNVTKVDTPLKTI